MYEEYWGLKEKPFENTPDPKFFYPSPQHEEGYIRMLYTIKENKGAALLTGVYGCGKTLIARALMKELSHDIYKVALILNPRLNDIELLRMIVYQLGEYNPPDKKSDVLMVLERILMENYNDGKKTIIIIDEAHVIEDKAIFEEIRLLLNYQLEDKFLLNLLIFGQPELKGKIEGIKQLNQRIAMRFHLEPLDRQDTEKYIYHRLRVAESTEKLFDKKACDLIYERSGGIPRKINSICDNSLLTGFAKKSRIIDTKIVQETIQSLQL
jgi:type II secretory pathway predicted ATPase ExeA